MLSDQIEGGVCTLHLGLCIERCLTLCIKSKTVHMVKKQIPHTLADAKKVMHWNEKQLLKKCNNKDKQRAKYLRLGPSSVFPV